MGVPPTSLSLMVTVKLVGGLGEVEGRSSRRDKGKREHDQEREGR